MTTIRAILSSPYFLWTLLALPGIPMTVGLLSGDPRVIHQLLHPTGEFAARFMIIAMMATPLSMLLKGWRGPRWLVRNRRYFGVAAFGYAALHTVLYLLDVGAAKAVSEALVFSLLTGWLAFFIFVPLAATSMNSMVRRLGPAWKPLQRWVYAAAVLTLLHWAALHDWGGIGPALVHFAPLILLSAYRVWWNFSRGSRAVKAA